MPRCSVTYAKLLQIESITKYKRYFKFFILRALTNC